MSQRTYITTTHNTRRLEALTFSLKANLLQLQEVIRSIATEPLQVFSKSNQLTTMPIVAESITPLWTNDSDDKRLVAGKVHNLRVAIRSLNGIEIDSNRVFSFWKHVGRPTRRKGYVEGRELREGCLVASVGGGLCQLSNALYDCALQAGFEILERHRHTRIIPGSLAESDRDATVFWNYVDLRFSSNNPFRLEAKLTRDTLQVIFRGRYSRQLRSAATEESRILQKTECVSCNQDSCFRKSTRPTSSRSDHTAFLVDEYRPEFDEYIQQIRTHNDSLFTPINRPSFLKGNYKWTTHGFRQVTSAPSKVLLRSLRGRLVHHKAALHRRVLLNQSDVLSQHYASQLKPTDTHVVVTQSLLPFLWRDGHLGGRTFDVLMTQIPLRLLQSRLDAAFSRNSQSRTLRDFRIDQSLLRLEEEALHEAQKLITTHSEIGSLFPVKTHMLSWYVPESGVRGMGEPSKPRILFPAATLGRKGVYELRAAIRDLDVELVLGGPIIEDANFWQGIKTRTKTSLVHPYDVSSVVLPSLIENEPRFLLKAISAGVPVIASEACGVSRLPGVTTIATGNISELRCALELVIKKCSSGTQRQS